MNGPTRQPREAAGEAFVVEWPPIMHHGMYLGREHHADEPSGVSRGETHVAQPIEGGANMGWLPAPQLQGDQLPHSPLVANPAIESHRDVLVLDT